MTCEYVLLQKKTKPMLDGLEQRGAGVYYKDTKLQPKYSLIAQLIIMTILYQWDFNLDGNFQWGL